MAEFKEFERRFKFKPRFPLKIVSNVSRFKPALNLNRVLADLNRGSNSLNSISDLIIFRKLNFYILKLYFFLGKPSVEYNAAR